jgi:hypothetical protein
VELLGRFRAERSVRISAFVLALVTVGRLVDDIEPLVEVDVDLAAVGSGHLHLVGAFLVTDLASGHLAAAGVVQRDCLGAVERLARDRLFRLVVVSASGRSGDRLVRLVVATASGRSGNRGSAECQRRDRDGRDGCPLELVLDRVCPPRIGLVAYGRDTTPAR